jgi:hypothetical protein
MPRSFGPNVKPSVSFGTMKLPKRGLPEASSPVRARTVTPKLMSVPALDMKAF